MSYYRYYDSPDGHDLLLKTDYVCRKAAFLSSINAFGDVLLGTTPKTYWGMAERFFRVFVPPVAAGAIFTTTVFIATKLRKKDDGLNHILGGITATYFLTKHLGNPGIIWTLCGPVCIALFLYKEQKLIGSQIQPDTTDAMYNIGSFVNEYDLYKPTSFANTKSFVRSDVFN